MKNFRNYISVVFLAVAVLGTLLSMAHYHNESMECLEHAHEQHYVENDAICPVCTVLIHLDTDLESSFTHHLEYQETLVSVQEIVFSDEFHTPLLGRAPPTLI